MRRAVLGLAVALGVMTWAVARPTVKAAPGLADDLGDVHSEAAAEFRFHSGSPNHWRQVALRR